MFSGDALRRRWINNPLGAGADPWQGVNRWIRVILEARSRLAEWRHRRDRRLELEPATDVLCVPGAR
ncbi:hypothetical protein Axi01nite_78910 [Actinoplanes xinjiangensis]|nr:hypothetical protein Axi01nite_78910 [Actinoplanes xinjiangensis]